MGGKYPDLEALELIAIRETGPTDGGSQWIVCDCDVQLFSQTWPSTACGWERPGCIAGAALTTDYTTVFSVQRMSLLPNRSYSSRTDYAVFFKDRLAYTVPEPNDAFFSDLRERRMASAWEATNKYKAGNHSA